jgi:hypothetical protein
MSVHVYICHLPTNDVKKSKANKKSSITDQKHNARRMLYYPHEEHISLIMVTHYMSFVS